MHTLVHTLIHTQIHKHSSCTWIHPHIHTHRHTYMLTRMRAHTAATLRPREARGLSAHLRGATAQSTYRTLQGAVTLARLPQPIFPPQPWVRGPSSSGVTPMRDHERPDSLYTTAANPRRGSISPPRHSLPVCPRKQGWVTTPSTTGPTDLSVGLSWLSTPPAATASSAEEPPSHMTDPQHKAGKPQNPAAR